jgi:hypothetical protein
MNILNGAISDPFHLEYGAFAQFQHNHNGVTGGYGDDEEML